MNQQRSPARFLIVSGTYLFLFLLAASLHTVRDHPWSASLTRLRDLFFIPVWICISFLAMITKKLAKKQEGQELIGTGTLFLVLILSVVGWFMLNMEARQVVGFREVEVVFLIFKIASLCISAALLSLAYVFLNKKAGIVLLILELIFWVLKTLMTYPASADPIFSGYFTVICFALRLVLVAKLVGKRKAPAAFSA